MGEEFLNGSKALGRDWVTGHKASLVEAIRFGSELEQAYERAGLESKCKVYLLCTSLY